MDKSLKSPTKPYSPSTVKQKMHEKIEKQKAELIAHEKAKQEDIYKVQAQIAAEEKAKKEKGRHEEKTTRQETRTPLRNDRWSQRLQSGLRAPSQGDRGRRSWRLLYLSFCGCSRRVHGVGR